MKKAGGEGLAQTDKTANGSDTEGNEDPDLIISIVNTVLVFASLALGIVGVQFIISSEYTPPPIPAGWIIGNIFLLGGSAFALQALISLVVVSGVNGCTPKTHANTARCIFVLLWGGGVAAYAVFRFLLEHPFVLTDCPCPAWHAEDGTGGCIPCPGFIADVCDDEECVCGNGVCSETTATCTCEFNWQIDENMTCTKCSDRTMDSSLGKCTRCRERFKPNADGDCTLCRNGYVGSNCLECAPGFQPRLNNDGSVFLTDEGAMVCGPVFPGCVDDQPPGGGRSGPNCEVVENCAQWGDVNAKVRETNADVALAQPATFTFNGQTCQYDHDCEQSYNCRGICSWGKGGLEGALCLEDSDCGGGVCEGRVCGLERRIGSTDCECSRAGFQAPRCQACPGFDYIYAESVCAGRGSCQAKYVDVGLGWASEYDSLQCVCGKPNGVLGEFPKYSGDYCEKIVGEDGTIIECAEGYFGDDCSITCPGADGWGGAAVCSSRGACKYDAEAGSTYCDCDEDTKPGGVGFYAGSTCEACAGEFYSNMCQPCPGLQVTSDCPSGSFLLTADPVTCFNSCNVKTCDDGLQGKGICF